MWKVYLLMVAVVAIISYLWVRGIYYKDDDFLNLDDEDKDWLS